jgi:hypothetical protein
VQSQFQATLAKLSELANRGHAGAKMVVDQLQRQGLSFGPGPAPEMKSEFKTDTKSETKSEPKTKPETKPDTKLDLKSIK